MRTINAIDLLAIADDYEDYKVRVCLQSLAYEMGKDDETFLHFWNKRDKTERPKDGQVMSLHDYFMQYCEKTKQKQQDAAGSTFVREMVDCRIINVEDGFIAGANVVAGARGLAYNDGNEVMLTAKGVKVVDELLGRK